MFSLLACFVGAAALSAAFVAGMAYSEVVSELYGASAVAVLAAAAKVVARGVGDAIATARVHIRAAVRWAVPRLLLAYLTLLLWTERAQRGSENIVRRFGNAAAGFWIASRARLAWMPMEGNPANKTA